MLGFFSGLYDNGSGGRARVCILYTRTLVLATKLFFSLWFFWEMVNLQSHDLALFCVRGARFTGAVGNWIEFCMSFAVCSEKGFV